MRDLLGTLPRALRTHRTVGALAGLASSAGFKNLSNNRRHSLKNDLQIQPTRHVFGVKDVQINHFREGGLILAVYLPVTGETWSCIDSLLLPRLITSKLVWSAWARADQAHLTAQDIKELRQFIQSSGPEQPSAPNNSRVAGGIQLRHRAIALNKLLQMTLVAGCFNVALHGSELQNHETSSAKSNSLLPKEQRAMGNNLNPQGDQQDDGQPERECQQNTRDIENALPLRDLPGARRGGGLRMDIACGKRMIELDRDVAKWRRGRRFFISQRRIAADVSIGSGRFHKRN
jgi:hypothetical protein